MNNHNGMRDDHDTHTHTDYSDTYSYGIVYVDNDIFHVYTYLYVLRIRYHCNAWMLQCT